VKIGFVTSCLPDEDLESIAPWAGAAGFEALEVAAWPRDDGRAPTHADVALAGAGEADRVRAVLDGNGLTLSALAYYENLLDIDRRARALAHEHLLACIDFAASVGTPYVGTFIGRDVSLDVSQNLDLARGILPRFVEYAGERGVEIIIENCPMEGWHPDGYPANLAYSPELWEWMFDLGLFLNFDPSHLVWLGIDPVRALVPYVDRVRHVQAKDTQRDLSARDRFGSYGKMIGRASAWDTGWWGYRIPGRGEVEWDRLLVALADGGFDGTISIEHEDPVWGGSPDRVREGLRMGLAYLQVRVQTLTPHGAPPRTEPTRALIAAE